MQHVLFIAIAVIGTVFVLLTALIVGNKLWRDRRERRLQARRRALEPMLDTYAGGQRADLRSALGGPVGPQDRAVLESLLLERIEDADDALRARLAQAFAELGLVSRYRERLRHRDWWLRAEAAEKLGQACATGAVKDLVEALHDEVPEVRLRAARALGLLGGPDAVRPLILTLNEPGRWSTIRIADILVHRGAVVVDALIELYPKLNPHGRLALIDVIGGIGSRQAAPWVRERLSEPDADIRSRTAKALGAIGDIEAGAPLLERLQDPEWPVRAMSAKALGQIGYTPAIGALCLALADRVWWVRANAAESLRLMGEPGLIALRRMLEHEDPYARHQALLMLQEAGVLDEEISGLTSPDASRRLAARLLIKLLIRDGRIGRLRDLTVHHADHRVREILAGLLADAEPAAEVRA